MQLFDDIKKGAVISDCGRYRYSLHRIWDSSKPYVCYIGLNPSTADAKKDDRTIRRLIEFTKAFSYGGFYICNVVPVRTKDPEVLKKELKKPEYAGSGLLSLIETNLEYICDVGIEVNRFVFCWGDNSSEEIDRCILSVYNKLAYTDNGCYCFGYTNKNNPRHPLYLKSDTKLVKYVLDIKINNPKHPLYLKSDTKL